MRNFNKSPRATVLVALLFLIGLASSYLTAAARSPKTAKKTTVGKTANVTPYVFSDPDFAFPKTVDENARKILVKALEDKDNKKAFQAAVQISVASNLISRDSVENVYELLSSLSQRLDSPYAQLAMLLEGRLLADVYSSKSWIFEQRILPSDSVPSDPMLWSGELFRNKIVALASDAVSSLPLHYRCLPIGELYPLIIPSDRKKPVDLDNNDEDNSLLYDFVCRNAISLMNSFRKESSAVIPFGDNASPSEKKRVGLSKEDIAGSLVDFYLSENRESIGMGRAWVLLGETMSNSSCEDYFSSLMKTEPLSPALIPVAYSYFSKYKNRPYDENFSPDVNFYNYVKQLLETKSARSCSASVLLDNILTEMNAKSLIAKGGNSLIYPSDELKSDIRLNNISGGYILLMRFPDAPDIDSNRKLKELLPTLKLYASRPLPVNSTDLPFSDTCTVSFGNIDPGRYLLTVSKTRDIKGIYESILNSYPPYFNVSAIDMVTVEQPNSESFIYVVDAKTQKPVKGAKVTFKDTSNRKNPKTTSVMTDSDGSVRVPYKSCNAEAEYGKSRISCHQANYSSGFRDTERIRADIFTDLSIYHPGDSIGFSAILLRTADDRVSLMKDRKVKIILNDANMTAVDSLNLVSDRFGRVAGKLNSSRNGMLGQWSIAVEDSEGKSSGNILGRTFVNISEYKSPTFFVSVDSIPDPSSELIDISGSVMTYSGMPVADAKISYNITARSYWPWWRNNADINASYGAETVTDENGRFLISLPIGNLKDTDFEKCRFILNVTAASPAGETEEAAPRSFSLAKAERIVADIPDLIEVTDKDLTLKVRVLDILDNIVDRTLNYSLTDTDGKIISSGEFHTPGIILQSNNLPSGKYRLRCWLPDNNEERDTVTTEFTLWRLSDTVPPTEVLLWTPLKSIIALPDNHNAKVRVGCSYSDNMVLMTVSDKRHVISREWISPKGKIVEVEVPAPASNDRVFVTFSSLRDFRQKVETVTVLPSVEAEKLTVQTFFFRDRLTPSAKETCSFLFLKDGKPAPFIPAMAVMTDKALDNIAPFSWSFNPSDMIWIRNPLSISSVYSGNLRLINWHYSDKLKEYSFLSSDFNSYGYALFGGFYYNSSIKLRSTKAVGVVCEEPMTVTSAPVMDMAVMKTDVSSNDAEGSVFYSVEQVEYADEAKYAGTVNDDPHPVDYDIRDIECPLAFFRPDLISDDAGMVSITYDVPDFNTTWKFQLLGYTEDPVLSTMTVLEAVASKKVMVSSNLPSFVRTGDKVMLNSTLFNNSDQPTDIAGSIMVYDAVSGETLLCRNFEPLEVKPYSSRLVSLELNVGYNLSSLRVVMSASSEECTDAEQALVPVLPSSSPVIESKTFYISPGERDFSMTVPELRDNSTVTLRYCDNPVWYCLTALPSITNPSSENALALSSALFGNCVGTGLISTHPNLKIALESCFDKNTENNGLLVSNLLKDENLKNVALNNTPWVNDAASETLRMSALSSLLSKNNARKVNSEIWNRLMRLHNEDGGWSWCSGMKSSSYMTMRVLYNLGMLGKLGYRQDLKDFEKIVGDAVRFCDNEFIKDYKRNPAGFNPESMMNYLFVRNHFSLSDYGNDFYSLRAKCISSVRKGWKKYDVFNKATAALLLHKEGFVSDAHTILKSLSQFSSYVEEKGRWFDNLGSGWNGQTRLITTTRVLEAFDDISPDAPEVDQIRQWLILQRETCDWGSASEIAEVVNAVLTSGSEWTAVDDMGVTSVISLDGKPLTPDHTELLTGAFTVDLDPSASGSLLEIRKSSSGPAWGGIISQFVAPMSEIIPSGVPDLSITKDFYVISDNELGREATDLSSLRKGDRVRVTLSVICGRDMDYVALTDERAACFTPVSQLSGYTSTGGLFYYQETRSSAVNLFFSFLPKGKHIITYDLFATQDGEFSSGIATIQSLYAPTQSAHSSGRLISVQ